MIPHPLQESDSQKRVKIRVSASCSAKELTKPACDTFGCDPQKKGGSIHNTKAARGMGATQNSDVKSRSGKAPRKIPVLTRYPVKKRSDGGTNVDVKIVKTNALDEKNFEDVDNCLPSRSSLRVSSSTRMLKKDKGSDWADKSEPEKNVDSCVSLRSNKETTFKSDLSLDGTPEEILLDKKSSVQRIRDTKKPFKDLEEKGDEEQDARRQDKIIENLYEAIKGTSPTLFTIDGKDDSDSLWSLQSDAKSTQALTKVSTVQNIYDTVMHDMSAIWLDAISLIRLVKDHTLAYVEEESKFGDRDQLVLEAEMLQLAVGYAVNYSKLKTDSLLQNLMRLFQVKEQKKTELELFMDSKLIADLYSDDDLETLAEAVQELNMGIQKGETEIQ